MKVIKVRVWDRGRMFYSDSQEDAEVLGAKLGDSCIATFFAHFYGRKLMFYITLKDKNQHEVYAGDIVNEGANHASVIEWCEHNEKIEGTGWCLHELDPRRRRIYHSTGAFTTIPGSWRVIGNIFETPQLLPAWYRKTLEEQG